MQLLSKGINRGSPKLKPMKAFVMKQIGEVGFMEKAVPTPGPDDAIVRTTAALISSSDTHIARGALGPRTNLTLGREAVGVVHDIGANVRNFKEGDRVVVGAVTPDWSEPAPAASHALQQGVGLGGWKFSNTKDGVFAEFFHVNQADSNMARIPLSVPDESAVYCSDTMPSGFTGAENGQVPMGGTVAVFGESAVGMMATAGASMRGAGLIIGIEHAPERQELARFYGADIIVDDGSEDPVERIIEITGGAGVDLAIEATGSDLSFQNCVRATKPGGFVSSIGYHGEGEFTHTPRVEWDAGMAEKTIVSGLPPGGRLRLERMLRLIEMKRVDPTKMTTHTFTFDQMEKAFDVMDRKADGVIKPLLKFPL